MQEGTCQCSRCLCKARTAGGPSYTSRSGCLWRLLIKTLQQAGVDTQFIRQSTDGETSLAFVSLNEHGERDFQFYRRHAADLLYKQEYLPRSY